MIRQIAPIVGGKRRRPARASRRPAARIRRRLDAALARAVRAARRRERASRVGRTRRRHASSSSSTTTALFHELLGQHDEHIKTVERALGVRIGVGDRTLLTSAATRSSASSPARVLDAALRRCSSSGYPIYAERRRLRGPHPRRDRTAKLRDIFLDTIYISAHKRVDHAEERRAEGLHRRDPQLRHRLRHRPGRHRQDLPRHGDGGRRAA